MTTTDVFTILGMILLWSVGGAILVYVLFGTSEEREYLRSQKNKR